MGSRNFTGNSQYIVGSVGVASAPATFTCWYQPLSASTGQETCISCRNLSSGRGLRNFGVWSLNGQAKIVVVGVNNNGNFFISRGTIMPIGQWNSTIIGSGICVFISGVSSDAGATWDFYWKFPEDADLTHPTTTDNGGVACPGGELYVGAELSSAGPTIASSCLGKLGQIGVWSTPLSPAQLLAWANGQSVLLASAYCAMPIEGVDPETNNGTQGSNVMDVVGDPAFTEISCVPSSTEVVPPGNPPIARPPSISGGPGGGLQVPTLDFGDGGAQQISPMANNARQLETPNFGGMGIAGPKGGMRAPKLGQRVASMFRNQEHLTAFTKGRKR